jgi:hypothetical protein
MLKLLCVAQKWLYFMHLLIKERQLWKVEARVQTHNLYGDVQWKCNFKKTLPFCTLIFWKVLLNNPYYLESMDLVHSREAFSPQGELWALFAISIMRTACPTKRPALPSAKLSVLLRPLCIKRSAITSSHPITCDKRVHPKLSWDNFCTKFRTPNNTLGWEH